MPKLKLNHMLAYNDNVKKSVSPSRSSIKHLNHQLRSNNLEHSFVRSRKKEGVMAPSMDDRLYIVAIDSMTAQIKMETRRTIVPKDMGDRLVKNLEHIKKEIVKGEGLSAEDINDVYDAIHLRLKELDATSASYIDAARSKHEQFAGDLRILVRDSCDSLSTTLQLLQGSLINKSEDNVKTLFPGYIHTQIAQPISLGHHLMAYVEMFKRDRTRLEDARKRLNESPYGSFELGGTSFNINRDIVSKNLGFDNLAKNSIDAVSARDFVIEFLSACANCSAHLSRLSEEYLQWHSSHCNFISFSDDLVEMDEILPYKRDPEMLEIVHAKTGKIYGNLINAMTTMNSMPLGYRQEYQELISPVLDSHDHLLVCANIMIKFTEDFVPNYKNMKDAASFGYSTAHDMRDWLIQHLDLSPADATEMASDIVKYAMIKNKKLSLLDLAEFRRFHPKIDRTIYSVAIPSRAIITRRSEAGTNPVQLRKAIREARRKYL